jgi:septal ring factor EnvC (AmiA/AmiB activator)
VATLNQAFKELQEVNENLATLHTDLTTVNSSIGDTTAAVEQVAACCEETNNRLGLLQSTMQSGFINLSQGMAALITLGVYTNQVLDHHSRQHETIICVLEKIYEAVCGLHNEAHIQTGLQTSIEASSGTLAELYKMSHAEAALELERLRKLEAQLLACCPPEEPRPVCVYQPCPAPPRLEEEPPRPDFDPIPEPTPVP